MDKAPLKALTRAPRAQPSKKKAGREGEIPAMAHPSLCRLSGVEMGQFCCEDASWNPWVMEPEAREGSGQELWFCAFVLGN